MNTSLITTNEHVDALSRVSKAMVASGYFTDAKDVAQAFVKVQAGAELGLPPVASMSGIHIVKGKPTLGANLIATLIKNDRRYNYRVLDLTDTICTIQFYEDGQACGISEFTADDAKRAGTQNMAKFPKNMLFARAISNGAKWYTPGIFGGVTVYTAEELGVPVDEEGDIIDMPHTEPVDIDDGPQEPAPEPTILSDSVIADLRATIEGAGDKVELGFVNQRLVDSGAYKHTNHAFNAVKMWPDWPAANGWSIDKLNGASELPTEKALAIFDWAIERKQDD